MEGGHPSIETMMKKGMVFPGFGEAAVSGPEEQPSDYSYLLPKGLTRGASSRPVVREAANGDLTRHLEMAEYRPISHTGKKDPWTGYRKQAIGEMVSVVEDVMYGENMDLIAAYEAHSNPNPNPNPKNPNNPNVDRV